jgi:ATP-dependent DNA helicase DinG
MAQAIEEAIVDQTDLVVEAATGTGKTLAYLLPILLHADRAILSTGTLNLQDQLFSRDLPLAIKALGAERQVALLKGRANYLCLQRLETHAKDESIVDGPWSDDFKAVQAWARHTQTGDISQLDVVGTDSGVWPYVTSTQDNCLGSECPLFSKCHVAAARRQAQGADIVVVNHHLLFADLALKQTGFGEVLPGAEVIVMDEAHQVPDTAMRFFSESVTSYQLKELARDTLVACGDAPGSLKLLRKSIEALKTNADQANSGFAELPPRGDFSRLQPVVGLIEGVVDALGNLSEVLNQLAEQTRDLVLCHERSILLHKRLLRYLQQEADAVRWYSHQQGRFSVHLTPMDIATPIKAIRDQVAATWILTSATLTVADQFEHFTGRLGLDSCRELIIPTPFDYAKQTRLWIPSALPEPNDKGHTRALLEQVRPLLQASKGRAFLLFTSHRALREAAQWFRAHTDFNLLVQEESARGVLLRRFIDEPNSVLLGAASFWEGVDVPGQNLSVVVIDKLPFAPPDDPVQEALIKAATERGERAFTSVQIPHAVLSLKQGVGRLIRQAEDFGVMVIGDPRIRTRSYGKIFLKSLPEMTPASSIEETIDFLYDQLDEEEA